MIVKINREIKIGIGTEKADKLQQIYLNKKKNRTLILVKFWY